MKSLIEAINNLASAISSLASSMKNQMPTKEKTSTPTKITKYPYTEAEKNINFSYNTYGSLSLDEREALFKIYKAIFNKGINEPLHDKILENLIKDLKRDWPALQIAIEDLIKAKHKSYNTINPYKKIYK